MPVSSMSHAQMNDVKGIAPETMKNLVDHWSVTTNIDYQSQIREAPQAELDAEVERVD